MGGAKTTVLILGSGPNALDLRGMDRSGFDEIVVINNAWQVVEDWTVHIAPEDFPAERHPPALRAGQRKVGADVYVPSQNRYGGVVYAGGSMAFTTTYWVLDALAPDVIAYLGCDMVYTDSGNTHFYGTGAADPLRKDPTLQSLEAKALRMEAVAAAQGCALVNLSVAESVLPYPRCDVAGLGAVAGPREGDRGAVERALEAEARAGLVVPSGRYWESLDEHAGAQLADIDGLWLKAFPAPVIA